MRSAEIPVWQTVIYMLSKIDLIRGPVQLLVSGYGSWITTWPWKCATAFLCCTVFTQVQIMDSLNLCRIPFQGLPLRGNLHSVDITRRIGSLICSRLTLNVIHSGQLEAWTFFVRETSLTKSFNQTTPKKSTAGSRTQWSTQEIQTCSLFKVSKCVGTVWKKKSTKKKNL